MKPICGIDEPYLRLTYRNGAFAAEGASSCYRGLQKTAMCKGDSPFFSWVWDGRSLEIKNDRYGYYPLFYYSSGHEFLISPSLLTLLRKGAPAELDWPALAVFLRLGNYVGEDTPFRQIRVVPPNAKAFQEGTSFRIAGVRPRIAPDPGLTRDAAIDGYIQVFREAISAMLSEQGAVVPLSGGRDSRHIFLELWKQQALPLSAVSVLYEPHLQTDDVKIARELASATDVPHMTVRVPANTVTLERRKNYLTNLGSFEHRWILPAADYVASQNATVYEGVAGEMLSTALWIEPARLALLGRGDLQELAESYLAPEGYLPDALAPEALGKCTRAAARQRIAEELGNHLEAANPLGSFHFWNRTRRGTALAPCCIWNQFSPVRCPYLDRRVFDFLSSIPAAMLIDREYHRFHTDTILRAYPEVAGIAFAGKDSKRRPARFFNWNGARQLATYELRGPAGGVLRGSFLAPRIIRALIDPFYLSSISSLLPFSIYLKQLEYCVAGRFDLI